MNIKFSLVFLFFFSLSCQKNSRKIVNATINSEVTTIDPHKSYDAVSNTIVYQMYETLFQYHYLKRPYALEPLLAKELPTISSDGLTYTIKIKDNIFYHNQNKFFKSPRKVISEDILNSFKRVAFKGTDAKGWWLFKDKIVGLDEFREKVTSFDNFFKKKVSGIVLPDNQTIVIKLKKRFPQFIHILSMTFTSPLPKEILISSNNNLEKIDIGTGPFILKEIKHKEMIHFLKNESYQTSKYPSSGDREANEKGLLASINKELPLVDELKFHVIEDETQRWKGFREGLFDFIEIPSKELDKAINLSGKLNKNLKDVDLEISSSLVFWWLGFNMRDPILGTNLKLRKAIAHAINMKSYVENFYVHSGRLANSLFPPGVQGYTPTKKHPQEYNLNEARRLLSEAGYPAGKGLPVLEFNTRRNSEKHILMGQFIKKELNKIGITVKIVVNSFKEFLQKAKEAKMQFWQSGWLMDYPDPENLLQLLYSKNSNGGPNKTGFNNKNFDSLYEQYLIATDEIKKLELLQRMEGIVVSEVPWIISNYSINYHAKTKDLENFRFSDLIFNFYKYLKK